MEFFKKQTLVQAAEEHAEETVKHLIRKHYVEVDKNKNIIISRQDLEYELKNSYINGANDRVASCSYKKYTCKITKR